MTWKKKWSYLAGGCLVLLIGGLAYFSMTVFTASPDEKPSTKAPVAQSSATPAATSTCDPQCKQESAEDPVSTVVNPYPTDSVIPSTTAQSGPIVANYPTPTPRATIRPVTPMPGATATIVPTQGATSVPPQVSPTPQIPTTTPVPATKTSGPYPTATGTINPTSTVNPTSTPDGNDPIPFPSTTPTATSIIPPTRTGLPQPPHWPPPPYPTWDPYKPTWTPAPTWTPRPYPTPTKTPTRGPTWTPVVYPTPMDTPTKAPTWTPHPSPTGAPLPTETIVPTLQP